MDKKENRSTPCVKVVAERTFTSLSGKTIPEGTVGYVIGVCKTGIYEVEFLDEYKQIIDICLVQGDFLESADNPTRGSE